MSGRVFTIVTDETEGFWPEIDRVASALAADKSRGELDVVVAAVGRPREVLKLVLEPAMSTQVSALSGQGRVVWLHDFVARVDEGLTEYARSLFDGETLH